MEGERLLLQSACPLISPGFAGRSGRFQFKVGGDPPRRVWSRELASLRTAEGRGFLPLILQWCTWVRTACGLRREEAFWVIWLFLLAG